MKSVIQLEIPDAFREALEGHRTDADIPRLAFEALVVEAVRQGIVSRGFGGELLGLDFADREVFFGARGLTYDLPPSDLEGDLTALDLAQTKR